MKVQITQRDEYFFVRRKALFGFHKYLAIHSHWWLNTFHPDARYYGFTSLEKAKAGLTKYVKEDRENKKFFEEEKARRRLQRGPMIVIEEIDIGD
jgi:Cu2+-containing amine oxidase